MTVTADGPVLSTRQLGRATLARQLLLEPSTLDVVTAVEAVAALQAQEPASPYIGLWARLAGFDSESLDRALAERQLVKGTLMRRTVHIASASDYRALWIATQGWLTGTRRTDRRDVPDGRLLRELRQFGKGFASEPRSLTELRDGLGERDGRSADELLWWLRWVHPLIHVPADVAWSFGRRPLLVDADAWLPAGEWPDPASAIDRLVRKYLAAFGPATVADIARWAGIPVATVRPGVDAVEAAGDLRLYRAETGRLLVDLADAPLPDEELASPGRLLPMWDSTILAHDDRTRIISDDERGRVVARNGDTLATILVDGVVAGRWWAAVEDGRTRLELEPFRRLAVADRIALDELAERLARFVEPLEPAVYARYRRWRKDDA
ncbi:MAG TPA: winged helix DNA-binding domain-containing protein [Candidatus Limnocylindrales bacterium]|nr:winged helix DNA-binding domain-containing protein [Candidatus Limnocylindrales bacterium]